MLMDEPFGAVDPIVRERLQNEFLRLQEEIAKTILFVTHDIDEAIKMGDLVAVLQVGGKLAQFGPPAEMLASPASEFVARFVGADRGLKRLSLLRVDDLTLAARADGRPSATTPAKRVGARSRIRSGSSSWSVDCRRADSAGSTPSGCRSRGRSSESMANPTSPLLNQRTTLSDALSLLLDASVQIGIVDGSHRGGHGPRHDRHDRRADARRPSDSGVPGRAPPADLPEDHERSRRHDPRASRSSTSAGSSSTSDDIALRIWQHIILTAIIAVAIGFGIALVLGIWVVRQPVALRPGHRRVAGMLYTIPSLAAFAVLVPITGLSLVTAVIPLMTYTLLILVRSIVAGFHGVPTDVLEAAEGMGYTRRQRLVRVEFPLAMPLIMAGLRLATVTTIGLATVASILGGDTFGGLGQLHHRGPPDVLPDRSIYARRRACRSCWRSPPTSCSSGSSAGSRRGPAAAAGARLMDDSSTGSSTPPTGRGRRASRTGSSSTSRCRRPRS